MMKFKSSGWQLVRLTIVTQAGLLASIWALGDQPVMQGAVTIGTTVFDLLFISYPFAGIAIILGMWRSDE